VNGDHPRSQPAHPDNAARSAYSTADSNADADLTNGLHAALAEIRGSALPCAFAIPPATGGRIDYGTVNRVHPDDRVAERVGGLHRREIAAPRQFS